MRAMEAGSREQGARSRESLSFSPLPAPCSLRPADAPSPDRPNIPPSATSAKKRNPSAAVQSPLETYLREINETALLNAAEERELATKIGIGDTAARDRMVRANLRLGGNIARGSSGQG